MTCFLQDLKYALRLLRKSPGFAAAVVATLALGIGANTAIFSLLDAVLLRNLPVHRPGQLLFLQASARGWPDVVDDFEGTNYKDGKTGRMVMESLSYPAFEQLARQTNSFSGVAAVTGNTGNLNVGLGGRAQAAEAEFVSGNFFETLGAGQAAGRLIGPADDTARSALVAVASHAFWRKWFGPNAKPEGRTVVVNGMSVAVIGVAPSGFFGVDPSAAPDLWFPLHAYPAVMHLQPGDSHSFTDGRIWWLEVIARLKPDVSMSRALAESAVIFRRTLVPPRSGKIDPNKTPVLTLAPASRGIGDLRRRYERPLVLLMGIVTLLLAIACANVAGLLASRGFTRRREIAIRTSLGAGRGRIVRQLLVESLLLTLVACGLGIALAGQLSSALVALLSEGREMSAAPALDLRVLGFAVSAALATGLLFGLIPVWRAAEENLAGALKEGGTALLASGRAGRLGRRLAVGQVALSVVLLAVAGLFVRTLANLESVRFGFDQENLLLFDIWPGLNGYSDAGLARFYDTLRERLAALPGVREASMSMHPPIGGGVSISNLRVSDAPVKSRIDVHRNIIGPGFFSTLGIPLLEGRAIDSRDDDSHPRVAVVSRSLARALFGSNDPIGRRVDFGESRKDEFEIVGVAGDARYHGVREGPPPTIYLSYKQTARMLPFITFEVRSSGSVLALFPEVRRVVAALDPNLPLERLETQKDALTRVLYLDRLFAALTAAFGLLALVLAAVGLYGTLAYAVAGRTREIGVRMALGARRADVIAMVLRSGLGQAALGVAVGLAAALFAARFLRSLLFGLSPEDPLTLVVSVGVLLGAAVVASYLPARRASKVDPMEALRAE
jgi:predicted permease